MRLVELAGRAENVAGAPFRSRSFVTTCTLLISTVFVGSFGLLLAPFFHFYDGCLDSVEDSPAIPICWQCRDIIAQALSWSDVSTYDLDLCLLYTYSYLFRDLKEHDR